MEDSGGRDELWVNDLYFFRLSTGSGYLVVWTRVFDNLGMHYVATPFKAKVVFGHKLRVFLVVFVLPRSAGHYVMEYVSLVFEYYILFVVLV